MVRNISRSANARGLNRGKTGSGAEGLLERSDSAILHNHWLIAKPAGLGGIMRHYYYGRFCRGFHAKDGFLYNIRVLLVKVGDGVIESENLGLNDQGPGDV
jgi:hypothetical protein